MNKYKNVWKKSIFKWAQILLCIVPLFVSSFQAHIKSEEAKFQVFDHKFLDSKILASLNAATIFFAETPKPITVIAQGLPALKPTLQQIAGRVSDLRDLFTDGSYWKRLFLGSAAKKGNLRTALSNVQEMEASIKKIEGNIGLMTDNHADMENKKKIAPIDTEIKKMMHFFANKDSLFKEYPLIGTPPLIELALLIAFVDYIAEILLLGSHVIRSKLSCKILRTLQDYRPRTVYDRLEKLSLESETFEAYDIRKSHMLSKTLSNAMSVQYNQYGYNKTIPATINCAKGCDDSSNIWGMYCVEDDFGEDEYLGNFHCTTDYALLIRHRVEQMFPVELLNTFCIYPEWRSGYGFLTIKFKDLKAVTKINGEICDGVTPNPCDPYVQLFIGDELKLTTKNRTDTCCYNVDVTFKSEKIHKRDLVKIEVWDDDSLKYITVQPDLVLIEAGRVDSFLKPGHIEVPFENYGNYIDTVSFWQDEY